MADEVKKPKLEVVSDEELDEDEREFRALFPASKARPKSG
jgi:hypothetical protein